jgi:pimeloyl-ACP methyl ester carboxylesterase
LKAVWILLLVSMVAGLSGCVSSALYSARAERAYPGDRFFDIDGTRMHALTFGQTGPVILMLHGASANAREFEATLAPRLSDSHRVILLDRPGHGHSERPANGHELGVQARLAAGVLDQLSPDEPAVVVGHSFGGAVALRLALDHPEKVRGLVLVAPVSHEWGGGGQSWHNLYARHPVIGPVFNQLIPLLGPSQAGRGIQSVFAPDPPPSTYFEDAGIALLFRPAQFRANALDVTHLEAELAAQQGRYAELGMPVTVFSGAQDTVLNPALHVGRLKHQVTRLDMVALPDGGHMPHHAQGADVADRIRAYAASVRPNPDAE